MWAAKWPDEARNNQAFNYPTWHYINFPYQPGSSSNSIPREIPGEENIIFNFQKNLDIIRSKGILAGGAWGEILLVAKSSRFREQRRNSLR
ncbi:hypothetical protein [Nostoc sp.]|uniref:hypothetical protein n=1 Tax=Nostoc sp. TaxID=1180 RepID=UPI002FF8F511